MVGVGSDERYASSLQAARSRSSASDASLVMLLRIHERGPPGRSLAVLHRVDAKESPQALAGRVEREARLGAFSRTFGQRAATVGIVEETTSG